MKDEIDYFCDLLKNGTFYNRSRVFDDLPKAREFRRTSLELYNFRENEFTIQIIERTTTTTERVVE